MRGRPLMEWLVFALVWVLLLVPLRRVTGGREVPLPDAGTGVDCGRTPVWVRLTFSEPPSAFTVYAGGEAVWVEADPASAMEQLVETASSAGLELELQWPDARRRAVELAVEPVEGVAWRRVLWTESHYVRESLVPE